MSQWQELTALCHISLQMQERVKELYGRIRFPYRFRSQFAEWIEAQNWASVDTNSDVGKNQADALLNELTKKIEDTYTELKAQQSYDLEKSLDFRGAMDEFRKSFEGNSVKFVRVLRDCLSEEHILIESCESEPCELKRKTQFPHVLQEDSEIKQLTESLTLCIYLGECKAKELSDMQDKFMLEYQQNDGRLKILSEQQQKLEADEDINVWKAHLEKKLQLEREQESRIQQNVQQRQDVAADHIHMVESLKQLLAAVWKQITMWKDAEKREIAAQVTVDPSVLDCLDKACGEVGQLFCRVEQQVDKVTDILKKVRYDNDALLENLQQLLTNLRQHYITRHLQHSFVIDTRMVERVLKVSSRQCQTFNISVRILGGASLFSDRQPPSVRIEIFQEKDIPDNCIPCQGVFEVSNAAPRQFAVNRKTEAFSASFNSIHLKNFRRPSERTKNDELVTEMKYAFVFYTTVTVFNSPVNLRVVSLPVILISQTSQEIMAKGTLVWDAAFSEQDRKHFVYRDKVLWSEVAGLLNGLFIYHTGRSLPSEQLDYLATVALRLEPSTADINNHIVTEKLIIRDKLSRRDFSFWKWIWACMNLLKSSVKNEWQDNLIYGFVSKKDANKMLIGRRCGTFLLRFSETSIEQSQKSEICGCLTVAFVEMDPVAGRNKVFHVREHLTPKELSEKGLAPVLDAMEVRDYTSPNQAAKKQLLQILYPDSPFEERFKKHFEEKERKDVGYTRGIYKYEIDLTNDEDYNNTSQPQVQPLCPSVVQINAVLPPVGNEGYSLVDFSQQQQQQQLVTVIQQTVDSAVTEPVVMATEPSVYPSSSQQLPQLPAFSDGQWFDSTIQTADLDLMSSVISPSLSLGEDEDGDLIVRQS